MHGVVRALHRYPIKSLQGEALSQGELGERGLAGDRQFAFIDDLTGKVASPKQPKLWSALLSARAEYTAPQQNGAAAIRVTFPDGRSVTADDAELVTSMSSLLGRKVRLVSSPAADATIERVTPEGEADSGSMVEIPVAGAAPAGTLFDYAPLHLVSSASLRQLAHHHPLGLASEPLRFRPNLVLDLTDVEGFVESDWNDRTLRVGRARLRVICATPRCAIPALSQGTTISRDPELIRTLGRYNRVPVPGFGNLACLGAYASVIEPGSVGVGDTIVLE